MHRRAVIVLFFAYLVVTTTAFFSSPTKGRQRRHVQSLECWKCDSMHPITCLKEGKIEKCQGNERTCQTKAETQNGRLIIHTGCKQGHACANNNLQNLGAAWDPTQCNKGRTNSVCRCCCTGNMCNRNEKYLRCQPSETTTTPATALTPATRKNPPLPPPDCGPHPETPVNGEKNCSSGTGPRSFCRFSCNKDYKMNGSRISICAKQGNIYAWNRPPPLCVIEEICVPLPETPDNGYKTCTGKGEIGSQCRFACETGYKRFGPEFVTCEEAESGLEWSSPNPTCIIDRCHPLPERPENGDRECIGNGEVGTKCEFTCDAGYDLIGQEHTVCVAGVSASKSVTSHLSRVHNMKAAWSNPTPTCKEVRCTLPKNPTNGHRECPGDGELDTDCNFTCHLGYRLKGFSSTTCKRDEQTGDARWTRKVPTCEPLCMTMPENPDNGSKQCDGKGEIDTVCTFECDDGFRLNGTSKSECVAVEGGADWSAQVPTCIPPPKCPPIGGLANREPNCNNTIHVVGTECTFTCDDGFTLVPETENPVVCRPNKTWSKKPCCVDCTKVKRDIMIAMDGSGSMKRGRWNLITEFVRNFIRNFTYGPNATLFSIFSFATKVKSTWTWTDQARTRTDLMEVVDAMKYTPNGATNTGDALAYAYNEFQKRSNRKDAHDLLLVLTDGKVSDGKISNGNQMEIMEEQAEYLRKKGVQILALAIDLDNDEEFIKQMKVMTGDRNKVITAGSTKELSKKLEPLLSKACQDERLCKR